MKFLPENLCLNNPEKYAFCMEKEESTAVIHFFFNPLPHNATF